MPPYLRPRERASSSALGALPMVLLFAIGAAGCAADSRDSGDDGDDTGGTGQGGSSGALGGGGTGPSGTGGSAAGGSAGTATGGTAGSAGRCNEIQLSPIPVYYALGTGTHPEPQGGTLTPGLYRLDSIAFYDSSDPAACLSTFQQTAHRMSLLIDPESTSNGVLDLVLASGGTDVRATIDYSINGTSMYTDIACGQGTSDITPYTAGATELTVFEPATGDCGRRVDFLRLQ